MSDFFIVDHGARTVKVRIYGTDKVVAELPAGDTSRICREIVAGLPEAERRDLIRAVTRDGWGLVKDDYAPF